MADNNEDELAEETKKLANVRSQRAKTEAERLKEDLKQLKDAKKVAASAQLLKAANEAYASAMVDASADVVKHNKELIELTAKQKHLSKQFSTVSNILSGVGNEFLKGIIGIQLTVKQQSSTRALLKKEEELLKEKLSVAEKLLGGDRSSLTQQVSVAEQQKKQNAERSSLLAQEISATKAVLDELKAQLQQSSSGRAANDQKFEKLSSINKQLESELQKHQTVLSDLDEKVASGKKLTKKEKDARSQSISKIGSITKELEKNLKALDSERKSRDDVAQSNDELHSKIESLTKALSSQEDELEKVTTALSESDSAIKKLTEEQKNAEDAAKKLNLDMNALGEVIKNTKEKLGNVTQEIKLLDFESIATVTRQVERMLTSLVSGIREFQQSLGISAADAVSIGLSNLKESIDSYISALSPFGDSGAPVTFKEIRQAQIDFQDQFGEIIDSKAARQLAQQAIDMGITTKQLADARRVFMTQTANNARTAVFQVDKFIEEFRKKGLSSKVAFEAITNYSELIARNGTRFSNSFTRAAAEAKKIGVDLNKVDQIGDNIINNFEGFLEKSAELGAMGFNLDFNTLAELAESGDTGALMGELRSQLALTGKDITKLRRSEQLALSEAFGIPMSDILKLSGKDGSSGEKTIEELTTQSNGFLGTLVDFASGMAGALQTANFLLGLIALNTSVGGAGKLGGMMKSLGGRFLPGAALMLAGGSLATQGAADVKQGNTGTGIAKGALGGALGGAGVAALGGAALAALLAPITGGSSLAAYALLAGTGALAGGAYAGLAGDDVVSKSGYGKRSLVTPSGVIALNNKDNIVAYADDFAGNTRMPYGSISDMFKQFTKSGIEYGPLVESMKDKSARDRFFKNFLPTMANKATLGKAFPNATKGIDIGMRTVPTFLGTIGKNAPLPLKYMAENFKRFPFIGSVLGGAMAGKEEYDATGNMGRAVSRGLLNAGGGILGTGLGAYGGPVAAAVGGIGGSNIGDGIFKALTYQGGIKKFATDKLSSIGTNLLGKFGLGGLGSMAGGPATMIASMAGPLLNKIPIVGSTLANITQAPSKLLGSAIGKVGGLVGGLFGKKQKPATGEQPSIAQSATNSLSMLSSLFGGEAQAIAPFLGSLAPDKLQGANPLMSQLLGRTVQQQQPQAQNIEQFVQKFMELSQKNNENMIQAIRNQAINVYMDSLKVGKGVVSSAESATQMGILAMEGRTR